MMVDASAMLAILFREPEAALFVTTIEAAKSPYTSAIAIYETIVAIMREYRCGAGEAESIVRQFLDNASIRVVEISDAMGSMAVHAFGRFGKGRHPAGLNMGDCFAYACAKAFGAPLLYKGDDFPKTDINADHV